MFMPEQSHGVEALLAVQPLGRLRAGGIDFIDEGGDFMRQDAADNAFAQVSQDMRQTVAPIDFGLVADRL